MILVTGGTGFVGQSLILRLAEAGHQVRTLVRPSPESPKLPRSVPVEVAVSGLNDDRGLRAAMVGVKVVYHLAGGEWSGPSANLHETDVQGSLAVAQAAAQAGVKRIFYLSHLGANRAAAYPVHKAKGIAEEHIRQCGVDYTIMRSAILFGEKDRFTNALASLLRSVPAVFLLPGEGDMLLQPLWVEDLVTCLLWSLDDDTTRNQIYEVGGSEYFTFRQIIETIMDVIGLQRNLVSMRLSYLRILTVILDYLFPTMPVSIYWLDYLATNRTTALDTIPSAFGLMPARFTHQLTHLKTNP